MDLGESFPTPIFLQILASIQLRTSLVKFLVRKSFSVVVRQQAERLVIGVCVWLHPASIPRSWTRHNRGDELRAGAISATDALAVRDGPRFQDSGPAKLSLSNR